MKTWKFPPDGFTRRNVPWTVWWFHCINFPMEVIADNHRGNFGLPPVVRKWWYSCFGTVKVLSIPRYCVPKSIPVTIATYDVLLTLFQHCQKSCNCALSSRNDPAFRAALVQVSYRQPRWSGSSCSWPRKFSSGSNTPKEALDATMQSWHQRCEKICTPTRWLDKWRQLDL